MIKAVIIFNIHGFPRLTKFFQHYPEDEQQKIIKEIYHTISSRDDDACNILEVGTLIGKSDFKLVYRHYATLYFVFCVDSSENELGILDLIQVFVESLDKCFENVCELDLIFHVDKVHFILTEILMGGLVLTTSMTDIVDAYKEQNKIEKRENGFAEASLRVASKVSSGISRTLKDVKMPDLTKFPELPNLRT